MIMETIRNLGPWSWWILGLILLILEVVAPGVFFLWFGIAAIATGVIAIVGMVIPWQIQLIVFAVLSIAAAYFGRKFYATGNEPTDQPHLNERGGKMIGQTATLLDDMDNGTGRVKIGDTVWKVRGNDLKSGSKVQIVGYDAGTLEVVAAGN